MDRAYFARKSPWERRLAHWRWAWDRVHSPIGPPRTPLSLHRSQRSPRGASCRCRAVSYCAIIRALFWEALEYQAPCPTRTRRAHLPELKQPGLSANLAEAIEFIID